MTIDFSSLRILVVDDQALVRALISQILRTIGFVASSISQSTDGIHAIKTLNIRSFDLIICDLHMEALDGMDLLKEIRCGRTQNVPNLPFIFLSAHPERPTIMQAVDLSADGFIVKPPKPTDIEKKIEDALKHTRPPVDPLRYLSVSTGSVHDHKTYGTSLAPPQSHDLDRLLEQHQTIEPLASVKPGVLLAQDLHAKDGKTLLPRGMQMTQMHLDVLSRYHALYGINALPIAHIPHEQILLLQAFLMRQQ